MPPKKNKRKSQIKSKKVSRKKAAPKEKPPRKRAAPKRHAAMKKSRVRGKSQSVETKSAFEPLELGARSSGQAGNLQGFPLCRDPVRATTSRLVLDNPCEPLTLVALPPQQHLRLGRGQPPRQDPIGRPRSGTEDDFDAQDNPTRCHALPMKWHCMLFPSYTACQGLLNFPINRAILVGPV